MKLPSSIVFGSQGSVPDPTYLTLISAFLLHDEHANLLIETINSLPEWWNAISESHTVLQRVPGHGLLERLSRWLLQGSFNEFEEPVPNTFLAPLTVVSHVVEYLSYLRSDSAQHADVLQAARTGGYQGLCIGQLAAIACSNAANESEIIEQAAVAIRLAVLIGAIIDLDGCFAEPPKKWACIVAREKSSASSYDLDNVLGHHPEAFVSVKSGPSTSTITLLQRDLDDVTARLEGLNFVVRNLELRGRFHSSAHQQAASELSRLCDERSELRFASRSHDMLTVRSGSTRMPISTEHLHRQFINDVLLFPSHWHNILSATMRAVQEVRGNILSVGRDVAIPDIMVKVHGIKIEQASECLLHHDERPVPSTYPEHAVAVVGMGCRFPGAASTDEFWELLKRGQVMASKVPNDRFSSDLWGNFVEDVSAFDHKFFGKSPREAAAMDPQQRLLLEVAYQAVESAGWFGSPEHRPSQDNVGCFIGCGSSDYNDNMTGHAPGAFSILGALRGLLSGRVSHHFGWGGPSITYDTACASSMAAIHAACQALQLRECDAAVAGGVNVLTSPNYYNALNAAGFLSKTGNSRAFEGRADGYCRGEGAGLVVLKRLDDALAQGDEIIGVISATAIMQNQGDASINVPSVASQIKLFQAVVDRAQIDASDVTLVEAHGTGTQVGDCVEAESVRQVFGSSRTSRMYLGSVKDVVGHTEGAAGIAGLVKALLQIRHGVIIPQPDFQQLNPKIPRLEANNIEIPRTLQLWTISNKAACVNNYGAGGCNGALIVCSHPSTQRRPHDTLKAASASHYPIFISAKSITSLRAYCIRLRQWVELHQPCLADVAFSLSRTQNHEFEHAISFVGSTIAHLCRELASYASQTTTSISTNPAVIAETKTKPIVLVFGGQTGRSPRLSTELLESCSLFRSHLVACDQILQRLGRKSIFPFKSPVAIQDDQDLVTAHSVLFSVQYAIAKCWLDCGVRVAALVGHSFGQLTALCVGGVLSLEDALKFVVGRALSIEKLWSEDHGAMIAVEADSGLVDRLVESANLRLPDQKIEVACYNGPTSFILAGSTAAINHVGSTAADLSKSIKVKKLDIPYAFHSTLTDPILPELLALAKELRFHLPTLSVETCSDATSWFNVKPELLVEHTRSPVFFDQAVKRLEARLGSCTWLEAGHGSPVIGMVRRAVSGTVDHAFQSLRLDHSVMELAKVSNFLVEETRQLAFWPFHRSEQTRYSMLNLPPYQFERNHHWLPYIDTSLPSQQIKVLQEKPQYLKFKGYSDSKRQIATFIIDPRSERLSLLVKGHAVLNTPLCPASAYIDLVTQAATHLLGVESKSVHPRVEDLRIEAPLGLDDSCVISLLLTPMPDTNAWSALFESAKANHSPTIHARCIIYLRAANRAPTPTFSSFGRLVDASAPEQLLEDRNAQLLSGPVIYGLFGKTVAYDKFYRGVRRVASAERETAACIRLPTIDLASLYESPCDPIAMDNFLQVAGIHVNFLQQALDDEVYIANHIENIMFGSDNLISGSAKEWLVYAKYSQLDDRIVTSDIFVFSHSTRRLMLVLLGVRFTRVHTKTLTKILRGANATLQDEKNATNSTQNVKKLSIMVASNENERPAPPQDCRHAKLCALLGDLLDVSIEQIKPQALLADLGIDSLMMTELGTSIRDSFGITIATSELQMLEDVQALSQRLFPGSSAVLSTQVNTLLVVDEANVSSSLTSTPSASTALSSIEHEVSTAETSPLAFSDSYLGSFRKANKHFDAFAAETSFLGYWKDAYPLHARLIIAYIAEAFAALGCPLNSLAPNAPVLVAGVHFRHGTLLARLLEILVEHGIVRQTTDQNFVRSAQTIDATSSAALHARIIQQHPLYTVEHQLLRITGERFAECLQGNVAGVDLLFGSNRSRNILQDVYANAPVFRTATIMLARFLIDAFKATSQSKPIEILEIGAGTGGTTMFLVKELRRARVDFVYTFTDISASLVSKTRRKFSGIENMRFQVLDIEKPVPAELRGQYQTVISTNCVHATPDLVTSCQNIRALLEPHGFLALVELTRKMAWFDLVFGLLEGWWAFTDDRTHALVDEHVWNQKLRAAGYRHVEWSTGASKESTNIRIICGFQKGISDAETSMSALTLSSSAHMATSILIQGSETQCTQNIFAFPGGFGTAATYTPLPVLAPSIALYGLNSPFLKTPSAFDVSLGELTHIYLDEIRRVQPTGPYMLMGYSVGGVLAYEAARQLTDQGEEIRQLILLDSACPALIPPFPLSLLDFFDSIDRFKGTDQNACDSEPPVAADVNLTRSANGAKKITDPHVIATLQSLHKYTPIRMPTDRSPRTLLIAARHGIDSSRKVPRPDVNDLEQKVIEWVLDDRSDFTPGGFGWDRLIDAEMIEVVPVDGNHFSVMTELFISRVAGELRMRVSEHEG